MEDIKKMYAEELRELAKSRGVPGAAGMKKPELIEALEKLSGPDPESPPDRKEILFRKFGPGSEPVVDGRPGEYTPEPDPQEGEADPADRAPRGKVGEPIGKHRSPREIFHKIAADIDRQMTEDERNALQVLRKCGWQVLVYPQMADAYIDTAVRAHRIRGRYDIGVVRQKIRR
ncbi:MAG: Rho termination factor N-terminal domain-containing protein [Desulfobacteraceae bacterium]|nr:Rho termination factor N-terminal domain-containing protein [Desulfobacteraceae bacterium]